MTSLPPKIDQRTYEEIVQQTEAFAEDFTSNLNPGWQPTGAVEIKPKPEDLVNRILNQNISITVNPTLSELTGRILDENIVTENENIKIGTKIDRKLAEKIVKSKGINPVKILLATRGAFVDTFLAQKISQVEGLTSIKVKANFIQVTSQNWHNQILAENINLGNGEVITTGTIIDEDISQKLSKIGLTQVKVRLETDSGKALIRIFSRLFSLVSDRLNKVPEKNFLAFLDLIGGELNPPQPAKVPLTFYLAESSPVDALVPAYTQVSAPPIEGEEEEIIFETDRELVVTTAELKAVFVREPNQDKYSDHTLAAIGKQDESFFIFTGDHPIEHCLYVTYFEIFDLEELDNLTLTIETNNPQNAAQLSLDWSYWDSFQWQKLPFSPKQTINNNQWLLTFNNLTIPTPHEIHGKPGKWLQAKLNSLPSNLPIISQIKGSTTVNKTNLIPEICLYNSTPLDISKDFYPFGEEPKQYDTFYLALHQEYIKAGVTVTLNINLSHKPAYFSPLTIIWEIGNDQIWEVIGTETNKVSWIDNSTPIQFTENNLIERKIQFPQQLPLSTIVNGETRYWLRAKISQGFYGQKATTRNYVIYNEVAAVKTASNPNPPSKLLLDIVGSAADLFNQNDIIRLVWFDGNIEKKEEHEIETVAGSRLTLKTLVTGDQTKLNGAKILRKYTISETASPTYDTPVINSLKLSYNFTLTENAFYVAYNDFNYSQNQTFTTSLKASVAKDAQVLTLTNIKELAVGEFLTLNTETHQIEAIIPESNQVILTTKISQDYEITTPINRDFRPFIPTVDQVPTLYLGFNQSFSNKTVTLYAQVNPTLPDESFEQISLIKPQLIWEYYSSLGWQPLGVQDETKAFSQRGLIQFIAPVNFRKSTIFAQELYWLRVRWLAGNFPIKPRLNRILTNTIWAIQATTIREEILGSSNNNPRQEFNASYTPILLGQKLEVQEGQIPPLLDTHRVAVIRDTLGEIEAVWVTWQEVADFYSSNPNDRHYILDHQTGKISFGDGQMGMIPARGRNNIRLSFYRTGGGKRGNIASQTISQLKTTVPYIDRVINLETAAGGSQQEDLERLKQRVPKQLRHRNRAVTLEDIEDLAYEASTDVARVKLITPDLMTAKFTPFNENFWLDPSKPEVKFEDTLNNKLGKITNPTEKDDFARMMREINDYSGQVKLIVLPNSKERQPTPSLALLEVVENYIRSRCEATINLIVNAPKWQKITVTTEIVPSSLQGVDSLRNLINQRLEAFLHPLTGGKGDGWKFGRYPQESDFYALIQSISGVNYVKSLTIDPDPNAKNISILAADSLIFSGHHIVNITSSGGQN